MGETLKPEQFVLFPNICGKEAVSALGFDADRCIIKVDDANVLNITQDGRNVHFACSPKLWFRTEPQQSSA